MLHRATLPFTLVVWTVLCGCSGTARTVVVTGRVGVGPTPRVEAITGWEESWRAAHPADPLGNVRVTLWQGRVEDHCSVGVGRTDIAGFYRLSGEMKSGLPPDVTVTYQKAGYEPLTKSFRSVEGPLWVVDAEMVREPPDRVAKASGPFASQPSCQGASTGWERRFHSHPRTDR